MSKNCFIYETLNDVKTMNVKETKDGMMHLSGVFGVCGVRNNNSRVYETKNYAKMVESMQKRIEKAPIPGELEHPQTMNITLENISHRIDSINIDENGVVSGDITLLDTPKGQIAQAIVRGGLPLFISSRATGNVDPKSGIVTLENLQTYDLVGSPGFSQAELHLNENQIAESICESVYYVMEKCECEGGSVKDPGCPCNGGSDDANKVKDDEEYKKKEEEAKKQKEKEEKEAKDKEQKDPEKIKENTDMEMTEILEQLKALNERVNTLEESNKALVEENEQLKEAVENAPKFDLEKVANGIQNWIVEEYSPMIQQWMTEHCLEEFRGEVVEEAVEAANDHFVNETAPKIQNWIINDYSPMVENWCCTELAQGIQNWVVEEVSPEIENWMNESYSETVDTKIAAAIDESKSETKQDKLNAIDETLALLENIEVSKPTYSRKQTIVTENVNEPKYIAEMPADARVQWEMASQEVKESIARRAKLYNFMVEGAVAKFWEGIDFGAVKPANNIYEGLDNVADERERAIRAQFRSWRSTRK